MAMCLDEKWEALFYKLNKLQNQLDSIENRLCKLEEKSKKEDEV